MLCYYSQSVKPSIRLRMVQQYHKMVTMHHNFSTNNYKFGALQSVTYNGLHSNENQFG